MPLYYLDKILLVNELEWEITDVVVVYAESNKSFKNWYNFKDVNVETLENISWHRSVPFHHQILEPGTISEISAEDICFGENRGYWQVYFTHNGNPYKLKNPDSRMDLEPNYHRQNLKITISTKIGILANFQILSVKRTFEVIKSRPKVKGIEVLLRNLLDDEIRNVNLFFLESRSNPSNNNQLGGGDMSEESTKVTFDEKDLKMKGMAKSKENVPFTSFGHYHFWRLHFVYENYCYELECGDEKLGIPLKLTAQDHGCLMSITIHEDNNQKINVKFEKSGQQRSVLAVEKKDVETRDREIREMALKLNCPDLLSKLSSAVNNLIYSLRSLARRGYHRSILLSKQKWLSPHSSGNNSFGFFYPSLQPKVEFSEINIGSLKLLVATFLMDSEEKIVGILSDICEKIGNLKQVWDEISVLVADLKWMIENLVDYLELYQNVDFKNIFQDMRWFDCMQLINIICNVLTISGFNEIGLTFQTSKWDSATEVAVQPEQLALAIEEELQLLGKICVGRTTSPKPSNIIGTEQEVPEDRIGGEKMPAGVSIENPTSFQTLVICQNSLVRTVELFKIVRLDLIESLKKIGLALHLKNRDIHISMITSSSVGLVGAGLAIAGLILEPFTLGLSTGLVIAGIAIGTTGGALGIGTTIADAVLTDIFLKSSFDLALKDRLLCRSMAKLRSVNITSSRNSEDSNGDIDSSSLDNSEFKDKAIVKSTASATTNAGVVVLKTGVQVAKTSVLRIGSVTFGVIFDLSNLIFRSVDLSKGGQNELGYKLEAEAEELEREMEEILCVFNPLEGALEPDKSEELNRLSCLLYSLI